MLNPNPLTSILQSGDMAEISAAAYSYLMDLDRAPEDHALVMQHIDSADQIITRIDQLIKQDPSLVIRLQGLLTWFLFFTYCYHVLDQNVDRSRTVLPFETLRYRNLAIEYREEIGNRITDCIASIRALKGFNDSQKMGLNLMIDRALGFMPRGDVALRNRVDPLLTFLKTLSTNG